MLKPIVLLLAAGVCRAADYTWDASGGAPADDGTGNWNAAGGTNWFDGSTYGAWGNTTADRALFGVGNGAAGTITVGTVDANGILFNAPGSGNYTLNSGTITLGGTTPTITANVNATIGSGIAGSAGLVKEGTGTLSFSSQKTYTGDTTINAGILDLTGGGGSGGTIRGAVTVNAAGTLRLSFGDATGYGTGADRIATINLVGGNMHVNTTSNQTLGSATINMTGASITGVGGSNIDFFAGSSALNSLASATSSTISGTQIKIRQAGGLTMTVADGAAATDLSISSVVANDGAYTTAPLIKAGAGTLQLTNAGNTYTGATTISAGTFEVAGGGRLGSGAYAGTISNSGTLLMNSTANQTLSGIISGAGALVKSNAGVLTLSAANSYSGATTVSGGSLVVSNSLRNTSGITVNSGATLELGATNVFVGDHGTAVNNARVITVNGATLLMNGSMDSRIGNITLTNGSTWTSNRALSNYDVLLGNTSTGAATISVTGTGASTMNGSGGIHLQGVQNFSVDDTTGSAAADLTVSMILGSQGSIGGAAGGVNKTGAGTMLLTGVNTFTGNTTIGAGTLEIGGAGQLAAGSYSGTITNNGALNVNTSASQTLSGIISGSGSLTKSNSGTLTLSSANTFTGGVTVNAGTLMLGTGGATSTIKGVVTVNTGGTLNWSVSNSLGYNAGSITSLNIVGGTVGGGDFNQHFYHDSGSIPINMTGGTFKLGGPSAVGSANQFRSAPITVTASSSTAQILGVTTSATIALRESTIQSFNVGDGSQAVDLLVDVIISQNGGSGAVAKTGAGLMALTRDNAYIGATTISAGTMRVGNGGTTGSLNAGSAVSVAGALEFYRSNGSEVTIGNAISGAGTVRFLGTGATEQSQYTLSGNNSSFTGAMVIDQARVQFDNANDVGSASMITVNSGGSAWLNGATIARPLTLSGNGWTEGVGNLGALRVSSGTWSGAITLAGNARLTAWTGETTGIISGAIGDGAGSFGIEKTGTGTLTLSGANTYDGATTVNAGRLVVSNTLLNTSGITVNNGATAELGATNMFVGGHGVAVNNARVITVNGSTLVMNSSMDSRIGNVTLNNGSTWTSNRGLGNYDVLLANTTTGAATVSVTGSGASTMNGSGGIHLQGVQNFYVEDTTGSSAADLTVSMILGAQGSAGGSAGGINKTGAGTMQLTNADNVFTGATTIGGGTLELASGGRLGSGSYAGDITNNATLLINTTANQTLSGNMTGNGALVKNNTGILTLSTPKSYTGLTTVNGGTLTVNGTGTLSGTTGLSVASGATFNYLPATLGTMTMNVGSTLSFATGSILGLNWDASTSSRIAALGAATMGAGVKVSMTGTYNSGTTYTILTAGSGLDSGSYTAINNVDYTAAFVQSPTSVTITPTTVSPLTAAYWKGGTSGYEAVLGVASNWTTDGAGTVSGLTPGATADVKFSDSGAAAGNQINMILGANMALNSITLNGTSGSPVNTNPVSLNNAGGFNLTLGSGAGAGITMNAGAGALTLNPPLALGAAQTWTNNSSNALTVNGVVSGGGAATLTKAGTGDAILSAANTFSGGTVVNAGTLTSYAGSAAGAKTMLGTGAVTVNSGATVRLLADSTYNAMSYANNFALNSGTIIAQDAGVTVNGTLALTGANTINVVYSDKSISFSNVVSGSGSVNKTGTGWLWFDNTGNTYSGGTTVSAGTFAINAGTAAGAKTSFGTGAVTVNSGGVVRVYAGSTGNAMSHANNFTLNGGTLRAEDAVVTYGGTVTLAAASTVDVVHADKNAIFANPMAGAGVLSKTGNGTLILAANNGNTGAITISSGPLQVGNGGTTGTLGSYAGTITNNGTLIFNRSDSVSLNNVVTGSGVVANYGSGTLTINGTQTYTGDTVVRRGTVNLSSGTLNGTSRIVVGATGGTGTPVFNLSGGSITAGTGGTGNAIYLGATTSFPGIMNVSAGTFSTSSTSALITVGDNAVGTYTQTGGSVSAGSSSGGLWLANNAGGSGSVFTVSGGTFNAPGTSVVGVRGSYAFTVSGTGAVNMGTLQLGHTSGTTNNPTGRIINLNGGTLQLTNGFNYQSGTAVVNLNGGTLKAASSTGSFWNNNANVTATVGASGGTMDSQAYDVTISQVLGGSGALSKSGSGILTLSGANTYSGPLTVSAGHLNVTGSLGALSSLNVTPSTQFSYAPATPATLNLAASAPITLGNNSTVGLSWNTTTSSQIATSGAATVGSGVGFELFGTPTTATEYTLLTAASGLNNTYSVRNNYNYVVSAWNIDPSGTFVKMTPTTVTAITTAYWTGGLSGAANVWAASDGMTASNWADTNGAAVQVLVPGSGADVIVSNSALSTVPSSTTLGANMSVKSVTISDITNGLGLNADGYTLTVGTGGIAMTSGVPASTIGAKVALGANQTWTNDSTSPLTVSGVISGTSTLAKTGAGTVRVTATDNTFTGALTVSAGTFEVGGAGRLNLGSYAGAITANGILSINTSANQILSGTMTGTGSLVKGGAGTLTLNTQKTYSGGTTVNGGILDLTGGGGGAGTIRGTVTVNTGATLRLSANDVTGYNTDSTRLGVINLVGGTMHIATSGGTGQNQTLGNAAINLTGGAITGVTGSNLDFFQGTSSINSLASATTSTISGVKLAIRQTGGLTIDVADGAASTDLAISSDIYNNGFASDPLTKTGAGTLLLSGNNSNTGATAINNGLVIASGGNALSDSSIVSLADSATAALQITHTEEVGLLSGGGGSGGNITLANGITLTTGNQGGSASYDGIISGPGASLQKRGGGNQTLTGDNSFSGGVTIQNGTITVPSIAATGVNQPLGAGATPVEFSGASGTLAITGSGATNRGLTLSSGSNTLSVGGTVTLTGNITGGNSGSTFTKAGAGTFNYSGTGSWSAGFNITAGTFELSGSGSIPGAGVTSLSGGASMRINTTGVVQTTRLTAAAGTTVNLEAGTLRVAGGDLGGSPVYSIDNTGSFTWGTGTTLGVFGGKTSGQADRTALAGAASGPTIKEGNYLYVKNDLTQPTGSTLDLGGLFGSSDALRYNQLHVTGALTIDDGASLKLDLSPYYLRPYGANERFTGDWGTLVLAYATGGITGDYDFANILGITSDRIGWTRLADQTDSNFDPASLDLDTYMIEYRTGAGPGFNFVQAGGAILLHYKVSGSVPEPASAGLLIAGALLLRALRRRAS